MATFEGERYQETKDWDIKEIAAAVRKDLKEAYPDYKFSVRIERFAMGQALHITVNNVGFTRYNANTSEQAVKLESDIRTLVYRYDRSVSEPMSDYFSSKFYANDIRVES